MAAIEADPRHLSAIGLAPMVKWVSHGCQTHDIKDDGIILGCAKMFSSYLEDVPRGEQDLEGTPFSQSENIKDNLDGNCNGCIDYNGNLEPVFRNTALFGRGCHGVHC